MDKVFPSVESAIADVEDGCTVAFSGFGRAHGYPAGLLGALADSGVKNLTLVCNSLGAGDDARMTLVENGQVRKLVSSFSARSGHPSIAEDLIQQGHLELQMVPQGILVERCRAAGAGIAAFFSPVGIGTRIVEGREIRTFGGCSYVLEEALPVDLALLRAWKADRAGNVVFRGGNQSFNPAFAKAARIAIVEVDQIVEIGEIDPNEVDLPGIFVQRVVQSPVTVTVDQLVERVGADREADEGRIYNGKRALTRDQMARRVARCLPAQGYVNLGIGIPTLVSNHLQGRDIVLHAENGILGYGGHAEGGQIDPDVYNASGQFVSLLPGASVFDSLISFEMARSGRLTSVVLGAYQVDAAGGFANWSLPGQAGGGIGGVMDLVARPDSSLIIIMMEHLSHSNKPKLVQHCNYPLTAQRGVDLVVTDIGLFRWIDGSFWLQAIAPGFSVEEVLALTEMDVEVSPTVDSMTANE